MAKFVLFGSTNRTVLHFIRQASASNLQILCLYPYEFQDLDRHSLLISSIGGIPIRYNFRNSCPEAPGYYSHEGLKSILEGTDGVIWATDPDSREKTLSRQEERFSDYLQDFRSTLSAMKELHSPRRFLLLARRVNYKLLEIVKDEWKWVRSYAVKSRLLANTGIELLESTVNIAGLKWTVLWIGRYLNGISALQAEKRGLELRETLSDGVWSEDVARKMVEILKVNGSSSMGLNDKCMESNAIEHMVGELTKHARTGTLSGKNYDFISDITELAQTISSPPAVAFSSADPILSTINPRNFPRQFAQLSRTESDSHRTDQFLEDIRVSRNINEIQFQEESIRNEQLRVAREKSRIEALKQGLPPPGADIKMLQKLTSDRRRVFTPKEKRTNKTQPITATKVYEFPKGFSREDLISTTSKPYQKSEASTRTNSGRTVLTLAEILLDRSADYLSPHLATPLVEIDYGEADYHPRWKYNRFKIKRPRNRGKWLTSNMYNRNMR